jgi:circadian clock protein KaiB
MLVTSCVFGSATRARRKTRAVHGVFEQVLTQIEEVRMKKPLTTAGPAAKRKSGLAGDTKPTGTHARQATYLLRLYISQSTVRSQRAVENIQRVCKDHLDGRYDLEVIDIHEHPNLARDEQIVAVPTLIKQLPAPLQRLVGDMSDLHKVLVGLDLKTREP